MEKMDVLQRRSVLVACVCSNSALGLFCQENGFHHASKERFTLQYHYYGVKKRSEEG